MKTRVFLVLLCASLFATSGFAAEKGYDATKKADKSAAMMEKCKEMGEKHEAMQKKMAERDARLQERVEAMNAATGEEKVEAIAVVINELIEQRRAMHDMMTKMGPEMMRHMMEHMHPEITDEMMDKCPMMKMMKDKTKSTKENRTKGHADKH
ncbi:hypothetical protein SAMN05660860_01870 [Geoalkalibacter ferrihydriticus]|uniref:Periplasmic heavy metal sensor n=2 Tax=Geoalkalibacter ferrihydriticus TaxID=392333 RepID=A0A0C2EFS4_9BACT|nr:hypothetical protein [Geoalkalibacter ferrihydriticus]KIH77478.1 hypothetical protein GFER_01785 [Geoalkalibacter ferrihydriticus DSM 17813]SDM13188.1 hypothetical protein SAMN05660860_01870 [Geoalkalibacter ferrihydriticus]